jgi:tetratricopeptide (TPR) repeat protein
MVGFCPKWLANEGIKMNASISKAKELKAQGEYELARQLLLDLQKEHPFNAEVAYQCAAIHDNLGLEKEAVPFYERAIVLGLASDDLAGAILGLGSTYRCLKEYEKSANLLEDGVRRYPQNWSIKIFLAMTYHESGRHDAAMAILLNALAETSADQSIQAYKRAIVEYAEMFGNQSNQNNQNK